nr:probable fructokinase-6, chloroplastic [Tanacetum cinerariifolium]
FSSQPSLRSGKVLASVQGSSETDESLVVCFGEMLIDFVPTINGLALAEAPAFKKAPGGAPANVAVGIARLGGSSAFIGKVFISIILKLKLLTDECFLVNHSGWPSGKRACDYHTKRCDVSSSIPARCKQL